MGSRPKIFLDRYDNAYVLFSTRRRAAEVADGHLAAEADLVILAATAACRWRDWRIVHTENGPFVGEMLYDPYRWQTEGVLSVVVQDSPARAHQPTPLRILDFSVGPDRSPDSR